MEAAVGDGDEEVDASGRESQNFALPACQPASRPGGPFVSFFGAASETAASSRSGAVWPVDPPHRAPRPGATPDLPSSYSWSAGPATSTSTSSTARRARCRRRRRRLWDMTMRSRRSLNW
ncbi:hypothetical protein Dda_1818 [Drechslerella dactyloides]|uniref:Uncharacterized protein n=1 Tax=Drechslerella dactyloides TaxID=74499 RepID=A0AAD6NM46_DREDA|nr:hypothetical protein Dda_1818 [Drechslerella dactyloides]